MKMLDSQGMNEFSTKFNDILKKANSIAVVGHVQPDGDCIASTLVMQKYISSIYPSKSVKVVIESRPINDWPFGDLNDQIVWSSNAVADTKYADLVVFIDGNYAPRFTGSFEEFNNKYQVCIDHHSGSVAHYDLAHVDVNSSSAAEILLTLFWEFEQPRIWLDEYYAKIAMYGILSDSGNFRFVYESGAKVFKVVYELTTTFSISINELSNYFNTFKKEQVEFLTKLLSRTVYVKDQTVRPFTYTYFEPADTKQFSMDATKSGAAQYRFMFLKQIEGYDWGFIISQTNKNDIDISFRSQVGSYDVSQIAQRLGGGGHTYSAAGHLLASNFKDREDVVKLIIQTVKEIYHAD